MITAYDKAKLNDDNLHMDLLNSRRQILSLEQEFSGSKSRSEVGEKNEYPTIRDYISAANNNRTTYGPTASQLKYLNNANKLCDDMIIKLNGINKVIAPFEKRLEKIEAPRIKR